MNERPILIQGAMQSEIDWLIGEFGLGSISVHGGFVFYEGEYRSQPIVVSKTKMGEVAAAIATTLGIEYYHPAWIVNQGTAGALCPTLRTGDVIVGTGVRYFSQYAERPSRDQDPLNPWKSNGYRTFDGEEISMETDARLLSWIGSVTPPAEMRVHFERLGSGDVWSVDRAEIERRHALTGAVSESMECVGAYLAANAAGVALCSVRVISNNELLGEPYCPESGEVAERFVKHLVDAWIDLGRDKPFSLKCKEG